MAAPHLPKPAQWAICPAFAPRKPRLRRWTSLLTGQNGERRSAPEMSPASERGNTGRQRNRAAIPSPLHLLITPRPNWAPGDPRAPIGPARANERLSIDQLIL